jgi:hypothetical protein
MLVTNKPTMGIMADGKHAMLKSGGESKQVKAESI